MAANGTTQVKDHGYAKLLSDLDDVKGSYVDIGIFGGRNPDGVSILVYAVANEFGATIPTGSTTTVIPERSFLRSTVDENRREYQGAIDTGLTFIRRGTDSPKGVLTQLGIRVRQDVQRKIRTLRTPPNAASTIEQKGSSNPLIDTGTMRKAVEYKLGKVFESKTNKILGAK